MITLLIIIYISFISLGLPDAVLGSAWPVIMLDLSSSVSIAGYIAMTVSAGTIVSALFSNRLVTKFGTGRVTAFSVLLTAAALLGYSYANSTLFLFLMALPLGLGAGSVDAGLNNFVALHFKSKHMNWLHSFWGIGATTGPAIMSLFLLTSEGWRTGYIIIASIQAVLVIVLIVTLPLWKKFDKSDTQNEEANQKVVTNKEAIKIPYVKLAFISFIFFSATEQTTGLWAASYFVGAKGISPEIAARWAAFFYAGITVGRVISGFISIKISNRILIRIGQIICLVGTVTLILPLDAVFSLVGVSLLGLGTAPIFPAMLHDTPRRFGKEVSGSIMGLQMAFAYIGSTLMPPLFGSLTTVTSLKIYPYYIIICVLIMFISSEALYNKLSKRSNLSAT